MQEHMPSALKCALIALLLASAAPAGADPVSGGGDAASQLAQARSQKGQAAPAEAAQPGPQAAAAGADSAIKQRVDQLEEQLVDMQVVIGTLESLAKSGRSATPPSADSGGASFGGADSARIDGLETQVRALSAQIEQLTEQVRALSAQPRRTDAAQPVPPAAGAPAPAATAGAAGPAAPPGASRFGSTTVTAGTNDAIGGLIDAGAPATGATTPPTAVAPSPSGFLPSPQDGADAGDPKQLYEKAYGYLTERDYGAAETAFVEFLNRYPTDSLAGNAQYWLGEAYFVRGDYKSAAGAFLKGYKNYAKGARAPDSLLKLAMSLDRMGQKDAACSSYAELSSRFPNAPQNVKMRAQSERQRVGCP